MRKIIFLIACSFAFLHNFAAPAHEQLLKNKFGSQIYNAIGKLIWRNECANSKEKLTWWNQGEEFASLGIGHFIWYPAHEKKIFTQSFPELLAYLHKNNISIPAWLGAAPNFASCPWKTRDEFFTAFNHRTMHELRALLAATIDLQAQFIVLQTEKKLNTITAQRNTKNKSHVRSLIKKMQQSPNGLYALIDYINFKGEGTNPLERYQGQGWGLLQVLENVHGTHTNTSIVHDFVESAQKILTQRVQNSPAKRNEKKFLAGWLNRIATYAQPLKA